MVVLKFLRSFRPGTLDYHRGEEYRRGYQWTNNPEKVFCRTQDLRPHTEKRDSPTIIFDECRSHVEREGWSEVVPGVRCLFPCLCLECREFDTEHLLYLSESVPLFSQFLLERDLVPHIQFVLRFLDVPLLRLYGDTPTPVLVLVCLVVLPCVILFFRFLLWWVCVFCFWGQIYFC